MNYILTNSQLLNFLNAWKSIMKKPKLIIPTIYFHNVNSVNYNVTTLTSNHLRQKSPIGLSFTLFKSELSFSGLSNLFRLDLALFDHKKIDKELLVEYLQWDVCCYIDIKDFFPKQANFCKYT